MSFTNNDQVFHKLSEQELAEIIAYSLRKDHGHQASDVKQIARLVDLNPRIVRNWYEAKNTPSLGNFLKLISSSPSLMKSILELAGYASIAGNLKALEFKAAHSNKRPYGDNFVTINICLNRNALVQLHQRQLWFYGHLQKGLSLKAEDITNIWDVSIRTVKRDIAGLVELGLIEFSGASKNGRYVPVL